MGKWDVYLSIDCAVTAGQPRRWFIHRTTPWDLEIVGFGLSLVISNTERPIGWQKHTGT